METMRYLVEKRDLGRLANTDSQSATAPPDTFAAARSRGRHVTWGIGEGGMVKVSVNWPIRLV
eukprot:9068037-Heterocapsa_arctica.AAC.1